MRVRSLGLLACLVGLGACGETVTLSDDVDLTWDFAPTFLSRFDDDLHAPYVKGARVGLYVWSTDEDERFDGWEITSSDPSVFQVERPRYGGDGLQVQGHAVGEGVADLIVRNDDGRTVGRGRAEVLAPDRVELDAHAYLILGRDDEAPVDELRIVEGGTATYLVRYFRGGRELHGHGVLSIEPPAGISAEARQTFLFEDREWLTVEAGAPGRAQLRLLADGDPVAAPAIVTVAEQDLADVVILTQDEAGRQEGEMMVAFAQAYDATGERVFGVDYAWDLDGIEQVGEGDLYRYPYAPGQQRMVTARRGDKSDSTVIQTTGGYVDSSNGIGCATTGGGGLATAGLVAGLVALITRRSRRVGARCRRSA